jgi:hypothetical protein
MTVTTGCAVLLIWRKIASLTMSDCVKSFLSVLHRALERERHFALFEEVPCQPKARSVIVSGQDSRSDPCISSIHSWIMITTSNSSY